MEGGAKVKCKSCNDNKGAYNYCTLCPDDDDEAKATSEGSRVTA